MQKVLYSSIMLALNGLKNIMEVNSLEDKQTKTWGPLGVISILAGTMGLFLGGIYASLSGVAAALTGFIGFRIHQKLCSIGMYLGCIVTLFVTLQDLGIIKRPSSLESDKTRIIKSINSSISVHNILKNNNPLSDEDKERVIMHLKKALNEAEQVNIADIDHQVTGFAAHYKDEFIEGVKLLIDGFEDSHTGKSLKGAVLMEKWARWNRDNRKELGKIEEKSLSIASFLSGI